MNVIKEIQRINAKELQMGTSLSAAMKGSWHDQYKDSAYIFVGGLPYDLTEGDIVCVFSQYGEIVDVNLVRDKATGKPKGFAFVAYEDQRSTVLAVDNFTGAKLLGRTLRVDHVAKYRPKKDDEDKKDGGSKRPKDEFERLKEEWQHDMYTKEQDRGSKRPREPSPPRQSSSSARRDEHRHEDDRRYDKERRDDKVRRDDRDERRRDDHYDRRDDRRDYDRREYSRDSRSDRRDSARDAERARRPDDRDRR